MSAVSLVIPVAFVLLGVWWVVIAFGAALGWSIPRVTVACACVVTAMWNFTTASRLW